MKLVIAISLILTIVLNLFVAVLVLRCAKKEQNILYLVINCSVILWAVGALLMLFSHTIGDINLGVLIFYVTPMALPIAVLLLSQATPLGIKNKACYAAAAAVFSVSAAAVILNINEFAAEIVLNPQHNIVTPNPSYFKAYVLFYMAFVLLAYLNFVRRIIKTEGLVRLQVSFVFIGVIISTVLGMYTNVFLPLGGNFAYTWAGPPETLVAIGAITLAMVRYSLIEIKLSALRALGYSTFVVIIGLLYMLVVSLTTNIVLKRDSSSTDLVINFLAALAVALTLNPLRKKFDKYTNDIFFRDSYDPQVVLNRLNAALVNSPYISSLLKKSTTIIGEPLGAVFNGIVIVDDTTNFSDSFNSNGVIFGKHYTNSVIQNLQNRLQKTVVADILSPSEDEELKLLLKQGHIALITKLTTKNQLVGLVILGDRKSGKMYNKRDIQLIETAADSIAIAAQNTLRCEEINEFNENLQRKIGLATHDLQKSNEKLKALDEAKDDFISMASHQLRTPLTSIKGYISMVLDGDAGEINDLQRRFLSQSFISTQRMVFLISDLLNASRLKTGKFIITNQPTYLPDLVEEEINQLTEIAKARQLKIVYLKPKNFPTINIDDNKIRQVIMNFSDNAIYYTPPGGKIEIGLKATPNTIEYTVKDNGMGVSRAEQKHLFTKFYRAANAKKARPDGTGLGIYMAKKVIVAQGGAIIFSSQENKGSTFGFSLPRAKVELVSDELATK